MSSSVNRGRQQNQVFEVCVSQDDLHNSHEHKSKKRDPEYPKRMCVLLKQSRKVTLNLSF